MLKEFTAHDRRLRSRRVLQTSEAGKSLRDLVYAYSPASKSRLRKVSGPILGISLLDGVYLGGDIDLASVLLRSVVDR
jgi:hypothetical protein